MDYHISTITTMLKVHDDMFSATNTLIKQTHVRHEKQIQRLENEIDHKEAMKTVMQEILIMVIRADQHHLDVSNYKFDEMLHIIDEKFNHLKAQAPTTEA